MISEIAGPSGAGKTTIALALSQSNLAIQTDPKIRFREFLPGFYGRAALSLPAYLFRFREFGPMFWQLLLRMAYLGRLHRVLSNIKSTDGSIICMDQGPVFRLTYLHENGIADLGYQNLQRKWQLMLDEWASMLDVVFWVDAPDAVLLERIRTRDKWHRVQGWSDDQGAKFLLSYREGYRQVIEKLTAEGGPKVIAFSTDREPVDQIVDKILDVLDAGSLEC